MTLDKSIFLGLTLEPAGVCADIIYSLFFKAAAETLLTIAVDPKYLDTPLRATLVFHIWGSAMPHHPHVHGIAPAVICQSTANAGPPRKPG